MNTRSKRIIITLCTALLMVSLLLPSAAFAAAKPTDQAGIQSISSISATFTATSSTKGKVSVGVISSSSPTSLSVKLTLQSAPLGKTTFTDVSDVDPYTYTVENSRNLMTEKTFPISASKEYRVKIEVTEITKGITLGKTAYVTLSR